MSEWYSELWVLQTPVILTMYFIDLLIKIGILPTKYWLFLKMWGVQQNAEYFINRRHLFSTMPFPRNASPPEKQAPCRYWPCPDLTTMKYHTQVSRCSSSGSEAFGEKEIVSLYISYQLILAVLINLSLSLSGERVDTLLSIKRNIDILY